jgi:hypothetical protein
VDRRGRSRGWRADCSFREACGPVIGATATR